MREVKLLKQLPWLVLALLLVGGSTLWILFVSEQQSHVRVAFQNQLERLGDELLRTRLEGRLGPETLPEGVRAFAIYGPKGELVASWGEGAPRRLEAQRGVVLSPLTRVEEWVDFVKVLQPLRPRLTFWSDDSDEDDDEKMRPMAMGRRSQGFLFVRVDAAPLDARLWAWTLGGGVGAAAWAGFIAFVGILWFRTRRYQEELNHHRELLQFTEASRTLSHELQNPLAAILLQTALLKRSSGDETPAEVAIIEEEARRMSALVSRVRDFLRDPKGQVETLDLGPLAESLAGRFALPVEVSVEGSAPHRVKFDPHRLRSVVENLIKNAVESGPEPRPRVVVSRPRAGWVRLEVLDSGLGFSPESLKQALQPFYTTKTTGTGIGLPIADGFVRAAGGRLRWENRAEGGARVSLDLPEASEEKA